MAACETYTCQKCGFSVEAWDDGNPYVETRDGHRHHFYHPGGIDDVREIVASDLGCEPTAIEVETALRERAGNAPDHLCPECGEISQIDPSKDPSVCAACGGGKVFEVWHCAGKPCPKCGGAFSEGEFSAIS